MEAEFKSKRLQNGEYCNKTFKLKVNPKDNTVTIKTLKNSFYRVEQVDVIEKYLLTKEPDVYSRTSRNSIKKWVEENL